MESSLIFDKINSFPNSYHKVFWAFVSFLLFNRLVGIHCTVDGNIQTCLFLCCILYDIYYHCVWYRWYGPVPFLCTLLAYYNDKKVIIPASVEDSRHWLCCILPNHLVYRPSLYTPFVFMFACMFVILDLHDDDDIVTFGHTVLCKQGKSHIAIFFLLRPRHEEWSPVACKALSCTTYGRIARWMWRVEWVS